MAQGGDGVAAAGDGAQRARAGRGSNGVGESVGGGVEGRDFEGAERAVPDQRAQSREMRDDVFDGARTDVEDHRVRRHGVDRDGAGRGAGLEFGRGDGVDGKEDLAAGVAGALNDVARGRVHLGLLQRAADGSAGRGEEGVGHRAADDQELDAADDVAEQVELG